jgi:hypothetical protein
MKRPYAIALLTVILLMTGPLAANAASEEKAREYAELVGAKKMMDGMITTMTDAMVKGMQKSNSNLPADLPDIVGGVVKDTISPLIPQMYDALIKMYAENISEEDLEAAIEFYRTPSGQRLLQQIPVMMQKGGQIGQNIVAGHIPEIQARLVQALKERHPELN